MKMYDITTGSSVWSMDGCTSVKGGDTTRQWALRYNLNVLINIFFLGRLPLDLGLGPKSLEQITL